jgi:O-antigen/teichoic acid export membrane protein
VGRRLAALCVDPVSSGPRRRATLPVRIATNTLVQVAGAAAASGISFFTFVIITRGLGPDAFGDYVAATGFLYIPAVLADLGLSTVVLREISADPARTEATMRRSLPPRALFSSAVVALSVLVGLALPFGEATKTAIAILSLWAIATLLNASLLPVLQAQLKMHWAVGANLAGRAATLALSAAAIAGDAGLDGVVWAYVAGAVVTLLIDVAVVARLVPLWPILDREYARVLFRGSIALGLAVGISQVYFRIDGVLLALVREPVEVGLYGAAFKFVELTLLIVVAVGVSVFPTLTRMLAEGEADVGGFVERTFDVMLALALPISIVLFAFAEELLTVTAGEEYVDAAPALRILALYPVLAFVNGLFWQVAIAAGRDRRLLAIALSVLTLNVALNLALLPPYGFRAAAVVALVSEGASMVTAALLARSVLGSLPSLRAAAPLAGAAFAMIGAIVVLPGPAGAVGAIAALAYVVVLALTPGVFRRHLREFAREVRSSVATT